MKFNLTLLVALFLIFVLVHCADPDLQVKKAADGGLDSKTTSEPNQKSSLDEKPGKPDSELDSKKADPLEKAKDQAGNLKGAENANADKIKGNPSKPLGVKETNDVQMDSKDGKLVKDGEKKSKADKGSGSEDVPKEEQLLSKRKDGFRGEQCDSAFKCTIGADPNHGIVACLRVPGDESPELSLLIQNKGNAPLEVEISAPDFVRLEKPKIQILANDDQKVMVSVGDGNTDKFINLKTGDGHCRLDFRDFLTHNPMKNSNKPQLTYINLFTRTPFLGLVSLVFLLVIALVVMYVSYQRRYGSNGAKYQKLDAELPVSGGAKEVFDQKDGWNDNWSDEWDDVEAPNTPSMPVTPSISSAGVSSRRVYKEGWKD